MRGHSLDYLPQDIEIWTAISAAGSTSLRTLCQRFWPLLRWRPARPTQDSLAEGVVNERTGLTRAQWIWEALGRLCAAGFVRVIGADEAESDELAAVIVDLAEPLRKRTASTSTRRKMNWPRLRGKRGAHVR